MKDESLRERTLVIFKSDVLPRSLLGTVMSRFESAGFKLIGAKMMKADKNLLENHYSGDMEWVTALGNKTIDNYNAAGMDIKKYMGSDKAEEIGPIVKGQLLDYMYNKPLVVTVWEGGLGTIAAIRKLIGFTVPTTAEAGSIRSDYSHDSAILSSRNNRAIMNLLHASGNKEEAEAEIKLWFGEDFKPLSYERSDEIFF